MITVTDFGCDRHNRRQVTLDGVEAEIMGDILYNLHNDGHFHTFICECGNTHRIGFTAQVGKLFRLSAMFSRKVGRSERMKPEPGHAAG